MDQTSSYTTFFTSTLSTCFLIRKFFPMGFGFFLSFFVHFCCSETCCFFVIPELRNMVIIKTWFDKIGYIFLLLMSFFLRCSTNSKSLANIYVRIRVVFFYTNFSIDCCPFYPTKLNFIWFQRFNYEKQMLK